MANANEKNDVYRIFFRFNIVWKSLSVNGKFSNDFRLPKRTTVFQEKSPRVWKFPLRIKLNAFSESYDCPPFITQCRLFNESKKVETRLFF